MPQIVPEVVVAPTWQRIGSVGATEEEADDFLAMFVGVNNLTGERGPDIEVEEFDQSVAVVQGAFGTVGVRTWGVQIRSVLGDIEEYLAVGQEHGAYVHLRLGYQYTGPYKENTRIDFDGVALLAEDVDPSSDFPVTGANVGYGHRGTAAPNSNPLPPWFLRDAAGTFYPDVTYLGYGGINGGQTHSDYSAQAHTIFSVYFPQRMVQRDLDGAWVPGQWSVGRVTGTTRDIDLPPDLREDFGVDELPDNVWALAGIRNPDPDALDEVQSRFRLYAAVWYSGYTIPAQTLYENMAASRAPGGLRRRGLSKR